MRCCCGKDFTPKTTRRQFCSPKCRAQAWRTQRKQIVDEALGQAERALEKARAALAGKGGKR